MKTLSIFLIANVIAINIAFSQGAAININGAAADNSAMLDVSSTTAGMLIPRMTNAQKITIANPATGLMIYQTNNPAGFWYYNGISWVQPIGPQGPTGANGANGATGANGSIGATGSQGITGSTGPSGADGASGTQGIQGITGPTGAAGITPANVFAATLWQSSNTSNSWENISTISYTIPLTGLYHVICAYESQDGSGGTTQYQRLLLGSFVGDQAQVGPNQTGYQFRTIDNLVTLSSGAVIYLQNQNDWNNGYKNKVRNIQFSIIKLN